MGTQYSIRVLCPHNSILRPGFGAPTSVSSLCSLCSRWFLFFPGAGRRAGRGGAFTGDRRPLPSGSVQAARGFCHKGTKTRSKEKTSSCLGVFVVKNRPTARPPDPRPSAPQFRVGWREAFSSCALADMMPGMRHAVIGARIVGPR